MFDISHIAVLGTLAVLFWIFVILPLAFAILIFISIGKGIAYLFRRDLYECIDEFHEVIWQKSQVIKELRQQSATYLNTLRSQDRKINEMQRAHAEEVLKAKLNGGNTGIFQNLPTSHSVVTELAVEVQIQPPPPPLRRGAPPPRPARQPRLQS